MNSNHQAGSSAAFVLRIAALVLAALCLFSACGFRPDGETPVTTGKAPSGDATKPAQTKQPTTTPPVTQTQPSTQTQPPVTTPVTTPGSSAGDDPTPPVYPYVNPLTGLGCEKDFSGKRPLAVVIANEFQTKENRTEPQVNLSAADILYEYPVEGIGSRFLAIFSDYESLGEVGALRSARYYDIQLALGHDAIYASYGGSDFYKIDDSLMKYGAYHYFLNNLVDSLDFLNDSKLTAMKLIQRDYLTGKGTSITNSVTVSGADFKAAIEKLGYSTTLSTAFDYGMNFSATTATYPAAAKHVMLNVTRTRRVDFIYNGLDGLYYRNQFSDDEGLLKHYDSENNKQLAFANVVLLYTDVSAIKEDAKSTGNAAALDRKYVNVVGSGSGFFISAGTYTTITWRKTSENAPLKYYDAGGNEIVFNPGKTCVEICSTDFKAGTTMN